MTFKIDKPVFFVLCPMVLRAHLPQKTAVVLPHGSRALSEGNERQQHTPRSSEPLFGLLCPSEQAAKQIATIAKKDPMTDLLL